MSDRDTCYFLKPEPGGDELLALAQSLSDMGYSLSCLSKSMVCRLEAKEILREHGARSVLTWGLMNEAVLPDNTPRDELLDTLRYQLGRCAATETLLVIACQARGGQHPRQRRTGASRRRPGGSAGRARLLRRQGFPQHHDPG